MGAETTPLVLLHGIGATSRIWIPVEPALAGRHDVIALDLPGHGGSPPLPEAVRPSAASFADAVERELDERGAGSVHLAGNSAGATVALELARRGRALTVTAIAPAGLGTARENRRTRRTLRLLRAAAPLTSPLAPYVARTAVGRSLLYGMSASRPWRVEPAEMVLIVRAVVRSDRFGETVDAFVDEPPCALERIRCPVTIAWGTADRLLPFRQAERWAERVAHAEVRPLPGLGHVPTTDDPALVADAILSTTARETRVAA
jgi:pimeloyl-ACP methyl ester carboxylesterase